MTAPPGSYVFAIGTTPKHAMDARKALAAVAPDAELLAREEEQWHYGGDSGWGFRFVSSSRADEFEARLIDTQTGWERRVREQALGSPVVRRFVEPVSVLVVALGGIGALGAGVAAGAGQEAGKDLYRALKHRIRSRVSRRRASDASGFETSGLARLFVELGLLYKSETAGGVVFLRLLEPRVTFIVEPYLPQEATKQAASIVLGDARRMRTDRPLRFDRRRGRWRAMPDDWFTEEALHYLGSELADRASNPAPHRNDDR